MSAAQIAAHLYCSDQTVREAIHAFHEIGLRCLKEGSHVPDRLQTAFDETGSKWLQEIVHESPRQFGLKRSLWRLEDLAQLAYEKGYTDRVVAPATISRTLDHVDVNWKRAKHWITSPDAAYDVKKTTRLAEAAGSDARRLAVIRRR